jgi:hypothetical protein
MGEISIKVSPLPSETGKLQNAGKDQRIQRREILMTAFYSRKQ